MSDDKLLEAFKTELKLALGAMDKIMVLNPELQKQYADELLKLHALVKGVLQEDDGKEH